MSEALWQSVGGSKKTYTPARAFSTFVNAGDEYWDFGWIPPFDRTEDQEARQDAIVKAMSPFVITGKSREDQPSANLTVLWKHPTVAAALGYAYSGTHQLTGSCVGAGGGNVAASLNFKEVVKDGEPEKVILPFYPYTYGRSRYHMGDSGRGEGSTGASWAKAAEEDGVLDNLTESGLPRPNNSDGLVWGSSVEMEWSAGGQRPCTEWLEKGKKYPIKTVSELRSAADVRKALLNYYPVTEASMYGFNPGVENDVLMGRRGPRWSHQMSFHGFWDHPKNGPIYLLMNQWGMTAHGRDPSGHCPGGGVWIPESDVEWICKSGGEVYAFSGYQGYPAPDFTIPWIF